MRVWYADFDIISWNISAYEVISSSVWAEKIFNVMFSVCFTPSTQIKDTASSIITQLLMDF